MNFLSVILAFLICSSVYAQELTKDKKYIFEFRDGTTIIGTYLYSKEGNVWIKDKLNDEVYLPKVMVAKIHEANENNIVNGEYWFPNYTIHVIFSPHLPGLKREGIMVTPTFIWQCNMEYQMIYLGFGT